MSLSPTTGYIHFNNKSSVNKSLGISSSTFVVDVTVGISAPIFLLVVLIIILVATLWTYTRRRAARQKQCSANSEHQDGLYSVQDWSELPVIANVYEQVHSNPSTEIIPSAENETISNTSRQPNMDFRAEIYSHINTEQPKSVTQKSTHDDPTYAVIGKGDDKEESKIGHDGPSISSNSHDRTAINNKASCLVENEPKLGDEALDHEEMYAVVNKKRKEDEDADALPVPPHTVEELYTAVAKTSKVKATDDKHKALQLPLPTHMTKKQDTLIEKDSKDEEENEKVPPPLRPHTVEELYTAVIKKPMNNEEAEEVAPPIPPYSKDKAENEEVAPPIPPHTVEELYTAVMKKSKGSAEDEEKAPPIPPYMANKL